MRAPTASLFALLLLAVALAPAAALSPGSEPDYSAWQVLLTKYYDPAKGMSYRALKAQDAGALNSLRQRLGEVDPKLLSRPEQLAYWINLYNVNVVSIVVEHYPVESIRDISTDPIIRLNVFKKDSLKVKGGALSLDAVENEKIRGFKDPRIHFAINCAAESCPSIRTEPYVGARIGEQLDDQARKFLNGPHGVKLIRDGGDLVVHTTKIMDWFGDDFDQWGGGRLAFLRKYVSPDKAKQIEAAGKNVKLVYDPYSWKLNDASR
ncbi:MAG TPA: DUF547 domain-containing protein [Thermoanaerobaculia bacterium]|nr:DUF547 domain-containing protein [Thermoanaerobaculia bacterium]